MNCCCALLIGVSLAVGQTSVDERLQVLEPLIGEWEGEAELVEDVPGVGENGDMIAVKLEYAWSPNGRALMSNLAVVVDGVVTPVLCTQTMWCPVEKQLVDITTNSLAKGVGKAKLRVDGDKVISVGEGTNEDGAKATNKVILNGLGTDALRVQVVDQVEDGKEHPDFQVTYKRVDTTSTREEFEQCCEMLKGRWLGDVTWVADWPDMGKKGDKVTSYYEANVSDDGQTLVGRWYGGAGSGNGLYYYDSNARQIKWIWVDSAGFNQGTVYKRDGKWIERGTGVVTDGRATTYSGIIDVADDGKTHTYKGSGILGSDKTDDRHDVWRRVSK